MIQLIGSICSMLGLVVSLYVLWREYRIEKDVVALKTEEETWHEEETRQEKVSSS